MSNGKAIIFSAPSGAGKTTIVRHLMGLPGLHLAFSVSATTRTKRDYEKDGVEYYFISAEEFLQRARNGEFIEWEEVYPGQYYGTLKSEIERIWNRGEHVIFDLDVVGGLNLGGSVEAVHNPVDVVEHALSKGATTVLMPVTARRALMDLSDDAATKVQVLFYSDAPDALRKALHEG